MVIIPRSRLLHLDVSHWAMLGLSCSRRATTLTAAFTVDANWFIYGELSVAILLVYSLVHLASMRVIRVGLHTV